jgi:ActR/RegA family two-component response regulator
VTVTDNVLIVEDEVDWCAIYERAARRHGISTVRIAHDLAGAETLLDEMKFSVAFVDIGLDVYDDRNIDGLRVMEKIRSLQDETSIIVVTGRSGRDVLPIARDALKKYDAFDTVGKVPLEPADISRLLVDGLAAYQKGAGRPAPVNETLAGARTPWEWDDQMLRATGIDGGSTALYRFLERLFGRFLPVVAPIDDAGVTVDAAAAVAHGEYWSRGVGGAVAVLFGPDDAMAAVTKDAEDGREVVGSYPVGPLLNEASAGTVRGAVYALTERRRDGYA